VIVLRGRTQAWVAAGFGAQYAARAARAILLARLLSPADLGVYFVLRSLAATAAIIAEGGLGQSGLRRVAAAGARSGSVRHALRHVAGVSMAIAPVAGIVTAVAARLGGASVANASLTGITAVLMAWVAVVGGLARGAGRVKAVAMADRVGVAASDLILLVAVILVARHATATIALAVTAAAYVPALAALGLIVLRDSATLAAVDEEGAVTRDLLDESWPITLNALLWKGLSEADLWIVAAFAGVGNAALYGIASRVAAPLQAPLAIGIFALSGTAASMHVEGRHRELEAILKRAARRALMITLPAYAGLLLIGPSGLGAVFGPAYATAMPLVMVLGIGQLLNVAAGMGGTTLLMIGRSRTLLALSAVSTAFTIVAAAALVSWVGVIGAAIASALGVTLQNALALWAVRKSTGMDVHVGASRA
jgi:O-antigen/teichoic acid export membrane protein